MAPSKSDRNAGNQPPALPRQNRPNQSPAPQVGNTEQAEQRIEQEVSVAIGRPAGTTITLSPQEIADYEEEMRLALRQPLLDHDDFAHLPLPTPYDPETGPYDWAKAEAWIQEKDSEGKRRLYCIRVVFLFLTLDRTNNVAQ